MTKKSLILILFYFSLTCSTAQVIPRYRTRARRESPEMEVTCDPPEIENGRFELLGRPDYEEGSPIPNYALLKVFCKKYYALYPESSAFPNCVNGNWTVPLQQCIRTCPARISTSVDVTCTFNDSPVDCTNPVLDGTVATSRCKEFYMSTDATQLPVTTCRGGVWDGPLVRCAPDCGEVASKGVINVVNGEVVKRGEFPWHIGLYRYENKTRTYHYKCGGSIISPLVIITAAHCLTNLEGQKFPAEEYHVGAGKFFSSFYAPNDTSAQTRQVKNYYIPSEYNGYDSSFASDIAVITVQEAFELTNFVRPVCVDWSTEFERQQLISNAQGSVAGWGYVDPSSFMISEVLRKLTAPFIDTASCLSVVPQEFRRWVTTDKFCAGYTNGTSVCQGDSGGGMVFPWDVNNKQKFFLRGVVSVGPTKNDTCDERYYGVYTRVSHYTSFILDVIRHNLEVDTRTYATGYGYCSEPEINNGKFDLLNAKYEQGFPIPNYSFLTVHCDDNYGRYPDVPFVFCLNGTWNEPIPECRKKCPPVDLNYFSDCSVDDTEISCYDDELLVEGAVINTTCRNQTTISKCIDGNWDSIPHNCPLPAISRTALLALVGGGLG